MILDPRFQQALEGSLPEAEWRKLLTDARLRQALAEQLCIDSALRVAFESEEVLPALEESIIASTQTVESLDLEARILASTQALPRKAERPMWHYHAFAAAAALAVLCVVGAVWLGKHVRFTDTSVITATPSKTNPASAPMQGPLEPPVVSVPPAPEVVSIAKTEEPKPESPRLAALPATQPPAPEPDHQLAATEVLPQPVVKPQTESTEPASLVGSVAKAPMPPKIELSAKPLTNEAEAAPLVISLPSPNEKIDFEKHVLPILERSCFECHSARIKKAKGDIRLDDLASIRAKSKTDNLVFPHKPERSTLLKSVSLPSDDDNFMPPTGKGQALSTGEIDVIKRWIDEGANFGQWTSTKARTVIVHTTDEAVDAANVRAVARRIDELIVANLKQHDEPPGERASDHTFVRRVYLDLVGRIPSFTELQAFLKDKAEDKRAKLIDTLLASNGHVSHMFNYWADLLRAKEELADNVDGKPYLLYIKQSLRDNKPYDEWAREMLSPEGFGWKAPATGYYLRDGANRPANIESTATLFLGTQISCAQCHDHPFDQWTRMDYHQFLAFTSGIKASNDDSDVGMVSNEMIKTVEKRYMRLGEHTYNSDRKEKYYALAEKVKALQATAGGAGVVNGESVTAMLPADYQYPDAQPGQPIDPKVLFGDQTEAAASRPADALAQWVTSPKNARFRLTIANRLWAKLFGAPFAGRLDRIREIADCDNPDLAAYLANVVRDANYDLRQVLRIFANTQAYQSRAHLAPESPDEPCRFAGPIVRRLSAEQVWDSMMTLAVKDLDSAINFEMPNIAKVEEASKATKSSDISRIARQMVSEDERKADADARKNRKFGELSVEFAGGGFQRASELPQPTPLGHFLRMFGQGNRDFIGDGWSAPTVPQSLLMLNSQFFDHVARSGSPLANALKGVGSREIVRNAFLAVLSREPTDAEIKAAFETIGETHNPKNLAKTLLTTAEFVFQK